MRARTIRFEKRYDDDSGVEIAVFADFRDAEVKISDCSLSIVVQMANIDWLIDALRRVANEPEQP